MILYLNNLNMFIENFCLHCVFEDVLNVINWVSSVINVCYNINLFNKLIQSREHRDFESFLQTSECFFEFRL